MALFKISRGSEKNLPTGITDGYAYFCTDNQNFYIDFIDSSGVSTRKKLGVEFADKLRYLKDGAYVEIDPTTLVVKTDLDNVAKLDADNTFTGSNTFNKGITVKGRSSFNANVLVNSLSVNESINISNGITNIDPSGARFNVETIFNSGAYFNGAVTIPTPRADNEAATKKYVDEKSNTFLKTITGYDASKTQILSHDANGNMAWINSIDTLLV